MKVGQLSRKITSWSLKVAIVVILSLFGIGYYWCCHYYALLKQTQVTPISGYELQMLMGPSQFSRALALAKNSRTHPDLYVSSRYRPDHPLYEGLLAIQMKNFDRVEEVLGELASQGDFDAKFWLAKSHYVGESVLTQGLEYQMLAEQGHPYAALALTPDIGNCSEDFRRNFLAYYCHPKWGSEGIMRLKSLSEQGDIQARYYYARVKNKMKKAMGIELTREDYSALVAIAEDGAEQHYYRPLLSLLVEYDNYTLSRYKRGKVELEANEHDPQSDEVTSFFSLLMLMADHHYLPAMRLLARESVNSSINHIVNIDTQWLLKARYQLGDDLVMSSDYLELENRENLSSDERIIESYMHAYVNLWYVGEEWILNRANRMYPLHEHPHGERLEQEAKRRAQDVIAHLTPMIYIDELNGSDYKFDFPFQHH